MQHECLHVEQPHGHAKHHRHDKRQKNSGARVAKSGEQG